MKVINMKQLITVGIAVSIVFTLRTAEHDNLWWQQSDRNSYYKKKPGLYDPSILNKQIDDQENNLTKEEQTNTTNYRTFREKTPSRLSSTKMNTESSPFSSSSDTTMPSVAIDVFSVDEKVSLTTEEITAIKKEIEKMRKHYHRPIAIDEEMK